MTELIGAFEKGELLDAFGTGTAALIARIESFSYLDREYILPPPDSRKISNMLFRDLEDLRTSAVPDKFGWIVKV
jgi:branched-chain amino acid aminotransferase